MDDMNRNKTPNMLKEEDDNHMDILDLVNVLDQI